MPEQTTPHPEDRCQRCGGRNIRAWFVDSDRFNAAMAALGLTRSAIVCPVCFTVGHELATGMACAWELRPGTHFSWLDDEDRERFAEFAEEAGHDRAGHRAHSHLRGASDG